MKSTNYQAYLLRLWRDGEKQPWRALLENPHTGEQCGFANLEQLFAYLEEQTKPGQDGVSRRKQAL
ncbi:MAG: hypothetical protein ACE5FD_11465 [Anaerolineae bacterium]